MLTDIWFWTTLLFAAFFAVAIVALRHEGLRFHGLLSARRKEIEQANSSVENLVKQNNERWQSGMHASLVLLCIERLAKDAGGPYYPNLPAQSVVDRVKAIDQLLSKK